MFCVGCILLLTSFGLTGPASGQIQKAQVVQQSDTKEVIPRIDSISYPVRQSWAARYEGVNSTADEARAIAVDQEGNVYVTGRLEGQVDGGEYGTVKYDALGNQLWIAKYHGASGGADRALGLAVDGTGNVYVTGLSFSSVSSVDYATVKYDAQGNEKWVARYDGQSHEGDEPCAVAVDGDGNVYVTGASTSGSYAYYATVKYDSLGNQLWVRLYGGGMGGKPTALTLDETGNVYVTGGAFGYGFTYFYATVKYSCLD